MTAPNRYKQLIDAIEAERAAEQSYYEQLSALKSLDDKVESGICIYPLSFESQQYSVGDKVILNLSRSKNLNTPNKFKVGLGCRLYAPDNPEASHIKGQVSHFRKKELSFIFNDSSVSRWDKLRHEKFLALELIYDDRPYRVMHQTMENVLSSQEPHIMEWKNGIRDLGPFESNMEIHPIELPHLNPSQNEALNGALASKNFCIIHGPPGTGKTTTLVSLIEQLIKHEKQVLVCAPSNNAVDILAIACDQRGMPTLRVGNVTRVGQALNHLTMNEKARAHPDWQHIKKVKIEAAQARKQANRFKRSFGKKERSNRKFLRGEAKDLMAWAKDLEEKLMEQITREAQVICTTLISASHYSISETEFNTVIIDEASQALEPECWNAMMKAKRVILAGDHLQLSPTVNSQDAWKLGFNETLLTRMTSVIKYSFLLNVQYRMNEKILEFSNQEFYKSKLKSADSVRDWLLEGDNEPITFIDTSGCGFEEILNPKTRSRYNEGEYYILREHFLQYKKFYGDASIGIISPYSEQVRFLRDKIDDDKTFEGSDLSIGSIDGFQGQERDVIYITLVRSNMGGEVGFLKDNKRLNVAMTRAKKKLIVIGDMSTLVHESIFNRLSEFVESNGSYKSAWEFMDTA